MLEIPAKEKQPRGKLRFPRMSLARLVGIVTPFPGAIAWWLHTRPPAWMAPALVTPLKLAMAQSFLAGIVVTITASENVNYSGVLGKRRDGQVEWWSHLLLWPYHVGLRSKLAIQRRISSEPLYSKVDSNWYIGGWPAKPEHLPAGTGAVLDCTAELPRTHQLPYLCLPTWDTHGFTADEISKGVAWAMEQRKKQHSVFVHCAHGHGRSAAVLCAALVEAGHVGSWEDARDLLKKVRPRVHMNERQERGLRQWAERRQHRS